MKQVLSAPRSPWQRAYVERLMGGIRRECLDGVCLGSPFPVANIAKTACEPRTTAPA
jgi:hypothetical protein